MARRIFAIFPLFFAVLCSPPEPRKVKYSVPENCNILSPSPETDCFFPFPTNQFRKGARVRIPENLTPFNTKPLEEWDGFSPASQIILWHPEGFSPIMANWWSSPAWTTSPTSPVQLMEFESGVRVPVFVEPDAWADPPQSVLYIRPAVRLKPSTRYIVVVMRLKNAKGEPIKPHPLVRAIKENAIIEAPGYLDEDIRRLKRVWNFVEKRVSNPEDVTFFWDFTTSSDEFLILEHLAKVKRKAEEVNPEQITFTVDKVVLKPFEESEIKDEYKKAFAHVVGTFHVPFTAKGVPRVVFEDTPFTAKFGITIPDCAVERITSPIIVFGHGLFGGIDEILSPAQAKLSHELCMIEIGTEWVGINRNSLPSIASLVSKDPLETVRFVVENLLQAFANFLVLVKLVQSESFWSEIQRSVGVSFKADTSKIFYLGISNGAIQGGTLLAISDVLSVGVLEVGGAVWTSMLERNRSWKYLRSLMKVESELDVKKLVALAQMYFDIVDPITFAPYILRGEAKLGVSPSKVLFQYALWDAQVFNFSSEVWARTSGFPMLAYPPLDVFGIPKAKGPVDGGAVVQFDVKVNVKPPVHNANPLGEDEQKSAVENEKGQKVEAHEAIRRLGVATEQKRLFFEEGKVYQLCSDEVCDPD